MLIPRYCLRVSDWKKSENACLFGVRMITLVLMPSYPRHALVPSGADCVLHVVSRCVRRARLCGLDPLTGRDFGHRRPWILARLRELSEVFAVEVLSYALMENHFHLVLRCRPSKAASWSAEETAIRWFRVFGPGDRVEAKLQERARSAAMNPKLIETWQTRLGEVSWFMRCLNEFIARRANAEDDVTGRFWEGRFFSQRVDGEKALIACMAYVDLNPVRAGLARSLRESAFTSAQERLLELGNEQGPPHSKVPLWLAPLAESGNDSPTSLNTQEYLATLQYIGEQKITGKSGRLDDCFKRILEQPVVSPALTFAPQTRQFRRSFPRLVAAPEIMEAAARASGRKWLVGIRLSRRFFAASSCSTRGTFLETNARGGRESGIPTDLPP